MTASILPSQPESRPAKPKLRNPIETAFHLWQASLPTSLSTTISSSLPSIPSSLPKRWTVYPPMVLLPPGYFTTEWWAPFAIPDSLLTEHQSTLWTAILREIGQREGKGALTHLATNAGIPLQQSSSSPGPREWHGNHGGPPENILRTPSGLLMLYGDFGPALEPSQSPTQQDFVDAFWVRTRQNGITQVWAPRYTMFSRGNVKEKARVLGFYEERGGSEGSEKSEAGLGRAVAVDLYAGIGYFVFSYVKLGMGMVVGWELNPWSVEGLRRGAAENGWSVLVVRTKEEVGDFGDSQIVVFQEDNRRSEERLRGVAGWDSRCVRHVNCGLLPSSEASWRTALALGRGDGWLHLHENVGAKDVERRKEAIEGLFRGWMRGDGDERKVAVKHVEYVKTFAPDVWHCVFDVAISKEGF